MTAPIIVTAKMLEDFLVPDEVMYEFNCAFSSKLVLNSVDEGKEYVSHFIDVDWVMLANIVLSGINFMRFTREAAALRRGLKRKIDDFFLDNYSYGCCKYHYHMKDMWNAFYAELSALFVEALFDQGQVELG